MVREEFDYHTIQHLTGLKNADFLISNFLFSFNLSIICLFLLHVKCLYIYIYIFHSVPVVRLDMLLSPAKKRKKDAKHSYKVSHDVHWRWCLVFWSLCLWPDGGLQHSQSHFVLAREGSAAHLGSGHASWKKGILYGEDRGIVPHWCMWLLVSVAEARSYSRWDTRYEQSF